MEFYRYSLRGYGKTLNNGYIFYIRGQCYIYYYMGGIRSSHCGKGV